MKSEQKAALLPDNVGNFCGTRYEMKTSFLPFMSTKARSCAPYSNLLPNLGGARNSQGLILGTAPVMGLHFGRIVGTDTAT